MTIWCKGMLAVAVGSSQCKKKRGKGDPKYNQVCLVVGVEVGAEYTALHLHGFNPYPHNGYCATCFRPAVLDHQEKQSRKANWLDDVMKGRVPA